MARLLVVCALFFAAAWAGTSRAQEILPRPDPPFGGKIDKVAIRIGDASLTPAEQRELDAIRGRGVMAE